MANPYFSCVLDIWVEGATIKSHMHYWRSGSYSYRDASFPDPQLTIAGETFTDSGFGNWVRSGIVVGDVYTTEFSKTVSSNGTYGVTFWAGAGQRSDFEGTWSGTATVSSIIVPPDTPTVSGENINAFSNKITYGVGSFGNPSSGRVYLYSGTSPYPTMDADSKTTTGQSTVTLTGLQPNTTYYYRVQATNGSSWSPNSFITIKTPPAALVPYPNDPSKTNSGKYIKKLEVSSNGLARGVTRLYRSSNGEANRIY